MSEVSLYGYSKSGVFQGRRQTGAVADLVGHKESVPWREAGLPNHHDDTVDLDQ